MHMQANSVAAILDPGENIIVGVEGTTGNISFSGTGCINVLGEEQQKSEKETPGEEEELEEEEETGDSLVMLSGKLAGEVPDDNGTGGDLETGDGDSGKNEVLNTGSGEVSGKDDESIWLEQSSALLEGLPVLIDNSNDGLTD